MLLLCQKWPFDKDDVNVKGMIIMLSKYDSLWSNYNSGDDITMQKKMAPFTKMTEMTPDNVINYVTRFAAEVKC